MHTGILGDTLDNAVLRQLPKRIIIGFVDSNAFNGNRQLNPFNFQNFSVNYLSLYVDGVRVPSKPLQPRSPVKIFVEAFLHTSFSGTGIHFSNEGISINCFTYSKGLFLTAFDLTPDMSAHTAFHWNLVRSGSICIEVRFDNALTSTINCIVYAECDNVLEIDSNRQIVTDFSP